LKARILTEVASPVQIFYKNFVKMLKN
jgi:hypothetical protein